MNIRRFCIILLLVAVGSGACAQGYFCVRKDARLEYIRRTVKDGSIEWRHIMTVSDVRSSGTSSQVTARSSFYKSNGKPLYGSDITERISVDDEGNVSTDLGTVMVSFIKARTGLNASAGPIRSVLPADMQSGDILPPVSGSVKLGFLTYTLNVLDRKVLHEETITVPAGTFNCLVIEERKQESGPGHNRDVVNLTWYCKGIGYVRHDTYVNGVPDTSEILESIR